MGKVITPTINPDIELDESRIVGMPDTIKQPLLITMTMAMEKYDCDWRDLVWSVKYYEGQPVISVKKKEDGKEK